MLCQPGQNLGYIVAWVDDHGLTGRFIAYDGAVALQRPDGKGFEDHDSIVREAARGVQMASQRICRESEKMAARKEWTEWHLTPRGWEKGATRVHGQGNTWVEEPVDRLLSCVYQEVRPMLRPTCRSGRRRPSVRKRAQGSTSRSRNSVPAPSASDNAAARTERV